MKKKKKSKCPYCDGKGYTYSQFYTLNRVCCKHCKGTGVERNEEDPKTRRKKF